MPESHVEYIWNNTLSAVYVPDDSPRKSRKAIAIVFAPDSIHPYKNGNWWNGIAEAELRQLLEKNDQQIGEAYGRLKDSNLTISDAKHFATTVFPNACFAVCENADEIQAAFDYWRGLGGDPIGLSDSDAFELDSCNATTFTHDCSDLWSRGFLGPVW